MASNIALAVISLLGTLAAMWFYYAKRRDTAKENKDKKADEAKDMYHEGIKNNDERLMRRAIDRLRRLRKP